MLCLKCLVTSTPTVAKDVKNNPKSPALPPFKIVRSFKQNE